MLFAQLFLKKNDVDEPFGWRNLGRGKKRQKTTRVLCFSGFRGFRISKVEYLIFKLESIIG